MVSMRRSGGHEHRQQDYRPRAGTAVRPADRWRGRIGIRRDGAREAARRNSGFYSGFNIYVIYLLMFFVRSKIQ